MGEGFKNQGSLFEGSDKNYCTWGYRMGTLIHENPSMGSMTDFWWCKGLCLASGLPAIPLAPAAWLLHLTKRRIAVSCSTSSIHLGSYLNLGDWGICCYGKTLMKEATDLEYGLGHIIQ